MPKLIISYRRSDSDAMAGRIRDNLAAYYGNDAIFIDIDNIPLGADFRDHIRGALGEHDLMIAVVGPKWVGRRRDGSARIAEETDPVRVEIEMALQRKMPIIPVLVNRAHMPKAEELPEPLKPFCYRNAAEINSGRDFRQHMDRLIRSMDEILGVHGVHPPAGTEATGEVVAAQIGGKPNSIEPQLPAISALSAFIFSYIVLIAAYYVILVHLDLKLIYLRLASIVAPLIVGMLYRESRNKTLGSGLLLGFAIALASVATMQAIGAKVDDYPILPNNFSTLRENAPYVASITFAFWTGVIIRHRLNIKLAVFQTFVRWITGFGPVVYWILGILAAAISIVSGLWEFFN